MWKLFGYIARHHTKIIKPPSCWSDSEAFSCYNKSALRSIAIALFICYYLFVGRWQARPLMCVPVDYSAGFSFSIPLFFLLLRLSLCIRPESFRASVKYHNRTACVYKKHYIFSQYMRINYAIIHILKLYTDITRKY